jgi:hypothetical protein
MEFAPALQLFLFEILTWVFLHLVDTDNLAGLARGARQTFSLLMIYSGPGGSTFFKYTYCKVTSI